MPQPSSSAPSPSTSARPGGLGLHILLIAALILLCFNLRTGFTSTDSLLKEIERALGLSTENSGIFALMPVFVLGIAAPLAPSLTRWLPPEKLIFWFELMALGGILWRSYGGIVGLFGGMFLLGLGMGVVGSEIPGLMKRDFPALASISMGIYAALVGTGNTVSAALAVPLAGWLDGWRQGLSFWALPVLLALVLWGIYAFNPRAQARSTPIETKISALLRRWRAWEVTLFYFSRVAGAYLLYTWIPLLLRQRGLTAERAALVLALIAASQIPASLAVSWLRRDHPSQKPIVAAAIPITIAAAWGMLYLPLGWVLPLAILTGLCLGSLFSVGMTVLIDRADGPAQTLELSGMAQGFGFTLGAIGAFCGSLLIHAEGPFWPFALLYTGFGLIGLFFGLRATRPGFV